MKKLYVIGIGPGGEEHFTKKCVDALKDSEVIVGYKPYLDYVKKYTLDKETFTSGMRGEVERCKKAIEFAKNGKTTSIISTGDAGLYGMAGPIYELAKEIDIEIEVIPGVSSAFSAASELGAPIMHDNVLISLSDLLTPWDLILRRVELASEGDFVISIYNPKSKERLNHLKEAVEIMLKYKDPKTPVGIVKNSGRKDTVKNITTLDSIDYNIVDMKTILIVGNKSTYIEKGVMITPRGYEIWFGSWEELVKETIFLKN